MVARVRAELVLLLFLVPFLKVEGLNVGYHQELFGGASVSGVGWDVLFLGLGHVVGHGYFRGLSSLHLGSLSHFGGWSRGFQL